MHSRPAGELTPVLLYRQVVAGEPESPWQVSTRTLAADLDAVMRSGRAVLTASALDDELAGPHRRPGGLCALTFDDGGATFLDLPTGIVQRQPGGLLALPGSNIGRFSKDRFAVVPEVGLNLGYQVTESVRAFVGYDFLYLSDVVRAGNQIDTRVNTNQLQRPMVAGGPTAPAFTFNGSDFWAQGLNFGLEFRYCAVRCRRRWGARKTSLAK